MRANPLVYLLGLNALLLGCVLLAMMARPGGAGMETAAIAQAIAPEQAPIAPGAGGGGGVFVVPAQFSINTWGCYLIDPQAQTICAYQYLPGEKLLRLIAARGYKFDRTLENFNTAPAPRDMQRLLEEQREWNHRRADVQTTQP